LFIPQKINVGFNNRDETKSGKLAFVTYFDDKGKLRKEDSWNSWRDQNIPNAIFENEPTEGFILVRNIKDTYWSYYRRIEYVRVFDPRGFDFEITVPNLMFILQNTTCVNGKLEGSFVYAWDSKDLTLTPTASPDYKDWAELNNKRFNKTKLTTKDLVVGATYRNRKGDRLVYLGRHDYYKIGIWSDEIFFETENKYEDYEMTKREPSCRYNYVPYPHYYGQKKMGKRYFFYNLDCENLYRKFVCLTGVSDIIDVVSSQPVDNLAELLDKLEGCVYYSPVSNPKRILKKYSFDEFRDKVKNERWKTTYIEVLYESMAFEAKVIPTDWVNGLYYVHFQTPNLGHGYVTSETTYLRTLFEMFTFVDTKMYLENGRPFEGEKLVNYLRGW
jgi:hypothetical protein